MEAPKDTVFRTLQQIKTMVYAENLMRMLPFIMTLWNVEIMPSWFGGFGMVGRGNVVLGLEIMTMIGSTSLSTLSRTAALGCRTQSRGFNTVAGIRET
jgi:hypothetical protein